MDLMGQFDLGYEGFSKANSETLEALSKALTAGTGVDAGSFTGGRALTPESLDSVLVSVLHTTDEARLFQRLKKNAIKSAVHQWNYRNEVGADDGGWVAEGGSSASTDQTIQRKYTTAKYLQTKRTVTLQAASTNMLEDAIGIEQEAGALWLIRNVEKGLIYGNSTNNSLEPDGLVSQIPAAGVLDLRGKDATSAEFEQAMNDAARQIRNYYGQATHMFSSTMVMEDVQALLRDRVRFGAGVTQGAAIFNEYPTPFGKMQLVDDVFIKEGDVPRVSSLAGIPGGTTAITLGSLTGSVSDATALFTAADISAYNYKIVPINAYGPGAAVEGQVTGLTVGKRVEIPISQFPVPAATAYKVFRSKVGGTSGSAVKEAFTVSHAQVVADSNKVLDRNWYLPGCSDAFILNMNPTYNAIEWVQFLPMMKFDLYPTDAAVYPFLMLLFGSLALKKPEHHIRIRNVSPSTLGWF